MNAIFVVLDWFWCLVILGSLEAYALGTWMRRCEDRAYAKQQQKLAYRAAVCGRG